jgi:hypothetical protein
MIEFVQPLRSLRAQIVLGIERSSRLAGPFF